MTYTLIGSLRSSSGTRSSRRARRQEQIPAVVYGQGLKPLSITLDHHKLLQFEKQTHFYKEPLELIVDGTTYSVTVKEVQRHPFKPKFLHLDFVTVPSI